MIVPQYWAEAKARGEVQGRPLTIRRFGWSMDSEEHALHVAEERAKVALSRMQLGERVPAREPKVPYNGADGVPIREEVITRDGDTVVTRNGYGALCLNTPDVLFADVDAECAAPVPISGIGSFLVAFLVGTVFYQHSGDTAAGVTAAIALVVSAPILHGIASRWWSRPDTARRRVIRALTRLANADRSALFDLYQTPLGHRVLARHTRFDPASPEAKRLLTALNSDPVFVQMCVRQRCFRARVTPKPWRIGMKDRMKPRPGIWPVNPARRAERQRWTVRYEHASEGYAACRFVQTIGHGSEDAKARRVRELHDALSRARADQPIA